MLLKRHCITLTTVFLSVHPNLRGFISFCTFLHRRNSPFAYSDPFCLCFDIEEADGTLHLVSVNVAHKHLFRNEFKGITQKSKIAFKRILDLDFHSVTGTKVCLVSSFKKPPVTDEDRKWPRYIKYVINTRK